MRATAKTSMSALLAIVAILGVSTTSANAASGGATVTPSKAAKKKASKKQSSTGTKSSGGASAATPVPETDSADAGQPTVPGTIAKIGKNGLASAPASAPQPVQEAIWTANEIIGRPYVYGGGHASFKSRGYDCSGTVSYALHGGDLLDSPLDSGSFMKWGKAGRGSWITIFTNPGHAYVIIAGIRLDTSAADDPKGGSGPRWRPLRGSNSGFVARHPAGL